MDDSARVLVLHTLRLVGVVQSSVVSDRTGLPAQELESRLRSLGAEGLVRRHGGSLSGWSLTTQGRAAGEELLAEELRRTGTRGDVEAAYGRFLELNAAVLSACTDWQVVAGSDPMVLNDHADPQYDESVLDRLEELHGPALAILASLTTGLDRFAGYGPRLSNALATARRGGVDWVTKPMIDSYHTVWFELHEDLLATLGRSRAAERAGREQRVPGEAGRARTAQGRSAPGRPGELL